MPNTSEAKSFLYLTAGILLSLSFISVPGWADNSMQNLGKAVVEKYQEISKPIFDPNSQSQNQKIKADPFFDKINQKRTAYAKKEQQRRRDFMDKVRNSDWTDEEKQQKTIDFNNKEIARREKFAKKQQDKINKHLGGNS